MVRKNRVISVIVIALLMFTACSKSGGSSGSSGDGGEKLTGPTVRFTFTVLDDGAAYSVGAGTATEGAVNIPAFYRPDAKSDYLPVTAIAGTAFSGCAGLTGITLPAGITEIGFGAFAFCAGLNSITIPEGVTKIGGDAFTYCTGITRVTIPASVTSVGAAAFMGWIAGQTITIQGKANDEAAIAAGWDEWWDYFCDAAIVYDK